MPAWYCLYKSAALLLSSLGGFSRLTEVGGRRQEEEMIDETKVKPLPSLRGLQSNHAVEGQCKRVVVVTARLSSLQVVSVGWENL